MNVIFDMDGLIFSSEDAWKEAYYITNQNFSIKLSEEYRQSLCGMNLSAQLIKMKKDYPKLDVENYHSSLRNHLGKIINTKEIPLKNGFLELIDFLKQNHIKTALATASPRFLAELLFKKADLDLYQIFDESITGDEVQNGKPSPEIYIEAVKKLGANAEDCFVLEDSPNGIIAGKLAGCKPILVVDLITPTKEIENMCSLVTTSLTHVKKYLEEKI